MVAVVWDAASAQLRTVEGGHGGELVLRVAGVSMSGDGTRVVGRRRWSRGGVGRSEARSCTDGGRAWGPAGLGVSMSGDGTRVASGGEDGRGGVGRGGRRALHAMGGHGGDGRACRCRATARRVGGDDGRVVVWDAASGAQLHAMEAVGDGLERVDVGRRHAGGVGRRDGRVVVWDAASGAQLHAMEGGMGARRS